MSNFLTNQLILNDGRTIREHLQEEGFFGITRIDMNSCDPQLAPRRVSIAEFEAGKEKQPQ